MDFGAFRYKIRSNLVALFTIQILFHHEIPLKTKISLSSFFNQSQAQALLIFTVLGFGSNMSFPCRTYTNDSEPSPGNSKRGCQILVVDDDEAMRSLLVDELQEQGCRVFEASDGKDALVQLQTMTPDLIITDFKMPGGGFEFLRNLRHAIPDVPIVLITAFGDSHTKAKAKECGVIAYMDKPVRIADLKASLTHICQMNPCKHSSPLTIL